MIYIAKPGLTEKGRVYIVKGKFFNNILYVRYVHLTKAKHIHKRHALLSSERMSHTGYGRKGSIEKNKNSDRKHQGAWRQDELIGGKPPLVK
jgi:hypothetical protein